MDKANFKFGSCKDSVENGSSDSRTGDEGTPLSSNVQKCVDSKNSVKKKALKNMSQRYPLTEEPGSLDRKGKEKKKKYMCKDDATDFSSESPKHIKNSKHVHEMKLEQSDLMAKMNSSDNMRKPVKQNRRASVPNNPLELKIHENVSTNHSPLPAKNTKSPKTDSKFRSKTPDSKGATGYTPGKKGNPAKRGVKFEPYIPLFQVQQGLKRGEFIEGALRINPRNYEDAYVSSPDGKMDIYIGGMQNRNRALNGDLVVVQINPKQEWKVLCDAIKDYQEKGGKQFVDTICEPVSPVAPCKVHTPDPFVRPRPFSSNSWDGAHGPRSPDTLEILGVDKLAKQFESISVKQKANGKPKCRRKIKNVKQATESGSQKSSTASHSQESSEDCLDKISPEQCSDKDVKDGPILHTVASGNKENSALAEESLTGMSSENVPIKQTYPPCNMKEIGEFYAETETIHNDSKWSDNENSVNLIISPDELLQIDGNSLLDSSNIHEEPLNDSCSEGGVIIVAPGDLSGDEFTDSASIDSSYSDHMAKVLEDSEFLASQQDAQNNNTEIIPQNFENVPSYATYDPITTLQTSTVSTESSLDAQCKMQFNKFVSSVIPIDENNSEVVCSYLSEVFPESQVGNIEDDIVLHSVTAEDSLKSSNENENNNQLNQNAINKKPRHRKRKRKSNIVKDKSTNDKINKLVKEFNDLHNLSVDQVMQHPEWPQFIQRTGKVVHVLERKHSYLAAGHLKLLPDKNVKWALFSPKDSRVPRILIPMSDCPPNFYHRPGDYSDVLFLAELLQWDDQSTYANGRLVKELGNTGDIDVETEGILIENGVDFQDFDEDVLACLPQNEDWCIPAIELKTRRDFRDQCVFTIDPSTARDMDDAVSCVLLENGNYEVGVHIADVTYFVHEDTDLDDVAKERSTSVYLIQKVVPMLPRRLCDELCSLKPGKDRLTFSVVWEMSPEGEIFNQWFGRSIINSCIKLSYEHAQDMIENPTRTWIKSEHPELFGNFTINDVIKRVNELHFLAVNLRNKRFMEGALRLDQVKLQFTLNAETGMPSGFNCFVQKDSNKLIEEFMLLANMSVATKIYNTFPSLSMLRRHPPPQAKTMQDVVSTCESMGIVLDTTTSGTLQASIARYKGNDYFSYAMVQVLMNLCSKPMNRALYFCTGIIEDTHLYRHYALNVPLYTHFTSPIRRYPDIVVHRLLGAALNYNPIPNMKALEMQKCALHCNDKKYNAKRVSELSSELFLAAFVRSLGTVHAKAMVVNVMDHSFDCLLLDMGIIKRVYCDKLPLLKKEYKRSNGLSHLNLAWKDDFVKDGVIQAIVLFTLVNVVMVVEKESLQIKVMLTKPEN